MRKSELIEQISKDAGIPKEAATRALNSFLDQIKKALNNKDGKFTLVGFGTFRKVHRKAHKDLNPQTVQSSVSQTLKKAMNRNHALSVKNDAPNHQT